MIKKAIALLGLLMIFVSYFETPSIFMGKIISLMMIISVAIPIVKSFKTNDYHILILFIFASSYILIPFNYFWLDKHIVSYNPCERITTVFSVLQIMGIFHFILLYSIKFSKFGDVPSALYTENNERIFCILLALSIIFTTFGSTGETIFQSGSYGKALGSRSSSSLFSYSLIPTSLCMVYANTKIKRKISYLCITYFCLKDILFGGRVETIQLLLILFFIKFQFEWSKKKILTLGSLGALFMIIWGLFRSDVDIKMIDLYIEVVSRYISNDSSIDYQMGNSAEVYYASVRVMYLIEEGILDIGLRFQSLVYFFISAVIPYSFLPDIANLSSYLQTEYWSGGGGLGPVFFYAFAGIFGVIVFTFFISHSLNLYLKNRISKYTRYYLILLLATTPRWYAYYPVHLIKFCVVGALFWLLLDYYYNKKNGKERIL